MITALWRFAWIAGLLFALASPSALAQPAAADVWQPIVWNLQACVRANMPLAHAAGIHSTRDAVSFFLRLCERSLQEDAEKLNPAGVAIAPGRLRNAVEDQWLKLRDGEATKDRKGLLQL